MTVLHNCPSLLSAGYSSYCPKALKLLFDGKRVDHILSFNIDEFRNTGEIASAIKRISVSGVQEKFPAIIEGEQIRITKDDERSTYILKPSPWDQTLSDRKFVPVNENLTMQIASQVYGIITAANGLCFTENGQRVYITRRFDVLPDGSRLAMEDFAAVVGRNEQEDGDNYKYEGCFEDIAVAIKNNVSAWMVDIERFFELVVFNYIYANGDDHLKNFSLILQGEDYRLAPAYDLLNTSLHLNGDDFGLNGGLSPDIVKSDVYLKTGHPCRLDFERFAERIGIVGIRSKRILDKYVSLPEKAIDLINKSLLTEKLKRKYIRIVKEIIGRFIRDGE